MRTREMAWDVPVLPPAEVLVVGGGPAGIAAATAAARNGAETVLVERYGFLGGAATAALVGPFMTNYDAQGQRPVVGGLFRELVDRMIALGGAVDPADARAGTAYASFIELGHDHVTPFDAEALKFAAMEMVIEAGVKHRLHTCFVDALIADDEVEGIVVADKGGLSVLEAALTIDATGDGDVAARAGADFTKGRESDGRMMPATLFFRLGNVDDAALSEWMREHSLIHPGERLFECIVREARQRGEFDIPREHVNVYLEPRTGDYRVNTTRLHDIDGTDPADLSRAEAEGRRQVMKLMRFFREECPGFRDAVLLETGAQVGIRETRHITGDYVLTGRDVLSGARFPDAIARYAFPIDIHDPTGTRGVLQGLQGSAPYYEIPYRCLTPAGVERLLVAGRQISATHEAAGSARVMPACYATGQAAGTAAALALRAGAAPREIDTEHLRAVLLSQGAILD